MPVTKKKKPKPVLVKWLDAHDEGETWIHHDEIEKGPCVVTSIGFLISGKPKHHTLAQSFTEDDMYNNIIYIPDGMVISVRDID